MIKQHENIGYPNMDFLRVRETLLRKQKETLLVHYDNIMQEIRRVEDEQKLIADLKKLYAADENKQADMDDDRVKE